MKTRRIGTTDLSVTEVAFGCASIGNLYREVSNAEAEAVLDTAWQAGIRYFDTAPHYGRGLSEARLGAFLKQRPEAVISTKVGRVLSPAKAPIAAADSYVNPAQNDVRYDYSGDGLEESFEQSCERLGRSHIDILYVHDIGEYTHGVQGNAPHREAFLTSGYARLRKLREEGRIKAFGLGVNESEVCLDVMRNAGPLDVILLAGRLTLIDRSAEAALVPACRETGTSLVLGGIFNSGILATGPVEGATYDYGPAPREVLDRVAGLQARAEAAGVPLATAALQFAMRHPATASVLLGTAKPGSLTRNLEALAAPMPEELAPVLA